MLKRNKSTKSEAKNKQQIHIHIHESQITANAAWRMKGIQWKPTRRDINVPPTVVLVLVSC